ncbi:NADPH-dependent ferric siderophore reductase [Agrobacterium vitis]|nr:NADPH-dependent ferric siderophore reductase [Agrobacterium vitis]
MSPPIADHVEALAQPVNEADLNTLKARVEIPDPQHCLRALADHLREDGMNVEESENGFQVTTPAVCGSMYREGNCIMVDARIADVEQLYFIKFWLQAHFHEIAGSASVKIDWSENCRGLTVPPGFSILTVTDTCSITPRVRRITFSTTDIARFQKPDAVHLRIMVNFKDFLNQSKAQGVDDDFVPIWRRYTVRAIDVSSNSITIDFFLHDTDGPGANWAKSAQVGDRVGISSLSGGGFKPADWYLMAGDETSLPAIGRVVETLPAHVEATAIVVVANADEIQHFESPANVRIEWIYRDSCGDISSAMLTALRRIDYPVDGRKKLVWAGCDVHTARKIRHYLRESHALSKDEEAVFGYWH